ncbi:MAG TPA: hypothetical protein DEF51_02535 [Myxococcales bacterium]|nr:hypothetical protein [Myxococcales bacterium]
MGIWTSSGMTTGSSQLVAWSSALTRVSRSMEAKPSAIARGAASASARINGSGGLFEGRGGGGTQVGGRVVAGAGDSYAPRRERDQRRSARAISFAEVKRRPPSFSRARCTMAASAGSRSGRSSVSGGISR